MVTDHALVRYIERVLGHDVESYKKAILTEPIKSAMRAGASSIKVDGVKYYLDGHAITTVYK